MRRNTKIQNMHVAAAQLLLYGTVVHLKYSVILVLEASGQTHRTSTAF